MARFDFPSHTITPRTRGHRVRKPEETEQKSNIKLLKNKKLEKRRIILQGPVALCISARDAVCGCIGKKCLGHTPFFYDK